MREFEAAALSLCAVAALVLSGGLALAARRGRRALWFGASGVALLLALHWIFIGWFPVWWQRCLMIECGHGWTLQPWAPLGATGGAALVHQAGLLRGGYERHRTVLFMSALGAVVAWLVLRFGLEYVVI